MINVSVNFETSEGNIIKTMGHLFLNGNISFEYPKLPNDVQLVSCFATYNNISCSIAHSSVLDVGDDDYSNFMIEVQNTIIGE